MSNSPILIHWKNIDVENIFLYFTKNSHEDYWFNKLYLKKNPLLTTGDLIENTKAPDM